MTKKKGFSLLEALIVLMIIGFILGGSINFLMRDKTTQDLFAIEYAVNAMVLSARQEALINNRQVTLHFFTKETPQRITLEKNIQDPENPSARKAVSAGSTGSFSSYTIPSSWNIKAIFNGSEEQLTKNKGHALCVVPTEGLLSPLLIQMQATQKKLGATLKSEPFQKKFSLHQTIINPPKKTRGV